MVSKHPVVVGMHDGCWLMRLRKMFLIAFGEKREKENKVIGEPKGK